MTKTQWKFWGASDDLAYYSKDGCVDEGSPDTYRLIAPNGDALLITVAYAQGSLNQGTWMVGIAQNNDGQPLPDWPTDLAVADDCNYSVQLTIETPADVVLEGFTS